MKLKVAVTILAFLIVAKAYGQAVLPTAPSTTKHAFNKTWLIFAGVAAADFASSTYDSKITWDGLNSGHGCSEANSYLGKNPSQGALYGKNMAITGGIVFAGFAMKKWLHLPIAPYAAMGIDTYKHAHGVHSWYTFKNGACL